MVRLRTHRKKQLLLTAQQFRRAPHHLLNVSPGQLVELRVANIVMQIEGFCQLAWLFR
jgi:hypothetical protein